MRKLLPLFIFLGAITLVAGNAYAISVYQTLQGGTGTSSPSGILYGDNNATTHLNTVTIGTGLLFSGGTLSSTGGGFGESWKFFNNKSYLGPTTTIGIIVNASSTIGDGTQQGGLTISGGSTTTGSVIVGTTPPFGCPAATCMYISGNDNTTAGVQGFVGNSNAGTSAYTGFNLENDKGNSNLTNFAGIFLNSSAYTDTTFGTGVNGPSQFIVQNTLANVSLVASTTTSPLGYINFLTGGSAASNERARITSLGTVGIATTAPIAQFEVDATSSATNIPLFALRTPTTGALATTTVFQVDALGSTTIGLFGSCSGGKALTTNASGVVSCGTITQTTAVTAVSVATANGFAGSSSGGTTPALTLTTTLTAGLVKANGTALVAAAYTDFPTMAANTVLANGTSGTVAPTAVATSTFFGLATPGFILAFLNGQNTFVATTTFTSPLVYSQGAVSCPTCQTAASAFAFTPTTYGAQAVNATSTGIWLTAAGGIPYSLISSSTLSTMLMVGTSSLNYPIAALTVGSSTAPQILLTDNNSGISEFFMRVFNKSWWFGTTTSTGLSTSTNPILTFVASTTAPTGSLGVGTSSPQAALDVNGVIKSGEQFFGAATSTNMTIDWSASSTIGTGPQNQTLIQIGALAQTVQFTNFYSGETKRIMICNPLSTAGALTFTYNYNGNTVAPYWSGGVAPTQTTTGRHCDMWSFIASVATSSAGLVSIFGAQTPF